MWPEHILDFKLALSVERRSVKWNFTVVQAAYISLLETQHAFFIDISLKCLRLFALRQQRMIVKEQFNSLYLTCMTEGVREHLWSDAPGPQCYTCCCLLSACILSSPQTVTGEINSPFYSHQLVPPKHTVHTRAWGVMAHTENTHICYRTSGFWQRLCFVSCFPRRCCSAAGGVSDLETSVSGSSQTQKNLFLFLYSAFLSRHSIVEMLMIHPGGSLCTGCRCLLHVRGECTWMNHLFHISSNEAALSPKVSVYNTLHLSAAPRWCLLTPYLSLALS